jgi:hypothetical protein
LGSNNAYGCMMMNVGYGLAIPRVDIWPSFLYKRVGFWSFHSVETI